MQKYIYNDIHDYEETHWWYTYKKKILRALLIEYSQKRQEKTKILDAGCGTGGMLSFLKEFGTPQGVDLNQLALAHCKKSNIKNVSKADVENLPYKQTFDVITLLDVLEHVDEDRCLDSLHRALTKKGILIVSVPAYQWMWSGWDVANDHVKRYNKQSLSNVVTKHGFTIKRVSYLYSFLVLPVFFVRKIKDMLYGPNYTSDIQMAGSPLTNSIMKYVYNSEFFVFSRMNIPFGLSVVLVAQKR